MPCFVLYFSKNALVLSFLLQPHDCECPVRKLLLFTTISFPHSHLHKYWAALCFEFSTLLNYTIDEEGTQKEFGVAQFNEVQGVTDEYGRPYYAIEFGDNLGSDALLINKGSEEVSTIIRVYGPVLNPFIRLYKKGQSNV